MITQGATQSNHVRQTIAGAARLGLQAKALLEQRVTDFGEDYQRSGNVLLDELLGGEIVAHLPGGSDMQQAMEEYAATLREQGHTPYIIPGGGSNPIGALGYVACAEELLYQSSQLRLRIDHVVHATGSTGTQAGLVAGFTATNSHVPVLGHQRACAEGEAGRERLASGGENAQSAGRGGRATAQRRGSQ
ncbi:D-cysteine desulfhydrase [Raoultella ornithinolytica]|nr:D-cysteine desulfhydrase [Raoultella ornithinolytica]